MLKWFWIGTHADYDKLLENKRTVALPRAPYGEEHRALSSPIPNASRNFQVQDVEDTVN